jgi:hypothetical protein
MYLNRVRRAMKIAICTPYMDAMLPDVGRAISRLESRLLQFQVVHIEIDMNVVSLARHSIAASIPQDVDLVWWIDSDVVLPENAVELLNYVQEYPLVSGLYVSRRPPFLPQAYNLAGVVHGKHPYLPLVSIPDKPTQVDAVGAGCLLMARSLLTSMQQAHNSYLAQLGELETKLLGGLTQTEQVILRQCMHYAQALGPWFEFLGGVGEDFYFCEQATRYCGVRPLLVPSVACTHIGRMPVGLQHFKASSATGISYSALGGQ